MIEQFYGMERPEVVEVHPPDVVKKKGHASSSASRLISKREKAIKEATRPLRRCKACDELGHHDSRNYPMLKELEKEKEQHKGKRMLMNFVFCILLNWTTFHCPQLLGNQCSFEYVCRA